MKIFIWGRLKYVSGCYHTEGGLVIVAKDLEEAKKLVAEDPYIKLDAEPDKVYLLADDNVRPAMFVFPDAGCC